MNYKNAKFLECLVTTLIWRSALAGFLENNYPASVLEDARLNTVQLLRKYNYPAESHFVTTDDKYILQMHRIPRPGAKPVFLMHGLLDASSSWIYMGPHSALAYYLYDEGGYDVWMGNARGNRYSRNHTILNPNRDKAFWSFSWHEIGYYDLPAMIDYVLAKTGYKKLTYFGHSQGTTVFFVMASSRPEYNRKLNIMHAMAPVAFMSRIKTPLKGVVKTFVALLGNPDKEFLPHSDLGVKTCFFSKLTLSTCVFFLWQGSGKDPDQLNMTMLPVIMSQVPAGCSLKQVAHYLQLVDSARFCQYDYGLWENYKRYGSHRSPEYPLHRITAPVGLYYAYNDYLAHELDVKRLAKLLPNVVEDSLYPYRKWNHLSMMWGIDSRRLAHKRMLELTRLYDGTECKARTITAPVESKILPAVTDELIHPELPVEFVIENESHKKDANDEKVDGVGGGVNGSDVNLLRVHGVETNGDDVHVSNVNGGESGLESLGGVDVKN